MEEEREATSVSSPHPGAHLNSCCQLCKWCCGQMKMTSLQSLVQLLRIWQWWGDGNPVYAYMEASPTESFCTHIGCDCNQHSYIHTRSHTLSGFLSPSTEMWLLPQVSYRTLHRCKHVLLSINQNQSICLYPPSLLKVWGLFHLVSLQRVCPQK